MVNCKILEDGNLLLTAGNDTRRYLTEHAERGSDCLLGDILEPYRCNGSFEPFDAGDGNPFVGLTSAPCIAESLTVHDDGQKEIIGRFWYFGNYMLVDPMEELRKKGKVIFTIAKEEQP